MSTPDDDANAFLIGEVAWQQAWTETHAEMPWPMLLLAIQKMHRADMAAVITVGIAYGTPVSMVSQWLTLLTVYLASQPDRGGPPDYDEPQRRLALAMLLAMRSGL